MLILRLFLIALLSLSINSFASDLAKEKRWADQVVDAIMDGEAVWINDGKSDFLGIYTEAEESKGRAVIVMHGTGVHPDWQQVIQPLRVGLVEQNWNTLSIQMPILGNDAEHLEYAKLYDEIAPRIDAAIQFLKKNGSNKIALIAHSQGSLMSTYYLAQKKRDVMGFVAIGMSSYEEDSRMNSVQLMKKIKLPMLDVYGTNDLENVRNNIDSRAAAAKAAGNKNFRQIELTGNHFFDEQEETLVKTVANWLQQFD